jgi:hypothetical protein
MYRWCLDLNFKMMKTLTTSMLLLICLCVQHTAYCQDDNVYYNQKNSKKAKQPSEFPFQIYADVVRPFYRDVNLNAEAALFSSFTISGGFGIYFPGKYTFRSLGETKRTFSIDDSGYRIMGRLRYYMIDNNPCDGPFSGFVYSYSALPGLRYSEIILNMGAVYPIYKNITLSFEFGLLTAKYFENLHNVHDDWLNPGFFANISLGYRFKSKKI